MKPVVKWRFDRSISAWLLVFPHRSGSYVYRDALDWLNHAPAAFLNSIKDRKFWFQFAPPRVERSPTEGERGPMGLTWNTAQDRWIA